MAVSKYFRHISAGNEQGLFNDLTKETIFQRGIDVYYIPRTENNIDYLFGEDQQSSFEEFETIEMVPREVEGFGGDGDFMSNFGLDIRDEITFEVSRERFSEEITERHSEIIRPREGDLLVVPFIDVVFEITFVEHETPFYMVGSLYKYVISTRRFEYTHEPLSTGIDILDELETNDEYSDSTELDTEDTDTPINNWDETDPFSEFT